jgi:N-acetyl-anhydromuramyl-L-alanine amidase AmpD
MPSYRYKKNSNRWNALDGSIEFGRQLDSDPFLSGKETGSHAYGFNGDSIGICMIGDKSFTNKQLASSKKLILELMSKYNINKSNIVGHYELNKNKTCPNIDMDWYRSKILFSDAYTNCLFSG